jgi:ABC-type Fe3+/spermidine/putrescine transport system ATPase subunit
VTYPQGGTVTAANPGAIANAVALEVDNVSKSFGSINALENVSLKIAPGRVTALVGDNGAGKSTLVKIISGILMPSGGTLRVEGKPVEIKEARAARGHGIHTVFQDLGLVGPLSIAENMFLCTEMRLRPFGIPTPFLDRDAMRTAARSPCRARACPGRHPRRAHRGARRGSVGAGAEVDGAAARGGHGRPRRFAQFARGFRRLGRRRGAAAG